MKNLLNNVRTKEPLVQCITNFVTVNDCANVVLASGGSPTMAHDENEVSEIATGCSSLVLNMGTLEHIESMINAGRKSNELSHPVILDPVAVGASSFRQSTFDKLKNNIHFSVIRGNASEIKFIATGACNVSGVDAAKEDRISEKSAPYFADMAKKLAEKLDCVIAISGEIDIVASKDKAYLIKNGCALMSRITGTGCMLTSMIGAFCGANPDNILDATAAAVMTMGISGELAYEKTTKCHGGTMTFKMHMIDEISLMTEETLKERARYEEV